MNKSIPFYFPYYWNKLHPPLDANSFWGTFFWFFSQKQLLTFAHTYILVLNPSPVDTWALVRQMCSHKLLALLQFVEGEQPLDFTSLFLSQWDRLIAPFFFCCISFILHNSIKKDLMPGNTRLPKSVLSASGMFVSSVPLLLSSPLHSFVPFHPSIPCQCVLKLISGLSLLGNCLGVCVCVLGVLRGDRVPLVFIFRHEDGTGIMCFFFSFFLMRFWSEATARQSQRHKERQTSRVLGLWC